METVLLFFWLLIVASIPVVLIVIGILSFRRNVKVWKIVVRLAAAFFIYVFLTAGGLGITAVLIFGAAGAHGKPPDQTTIILSGLIMLVIYGLCGGLLCWFTQQSLAKLPDNLNAENKKIIQN